ncbi:MAG: response regulator [Lachnospiraceae bacterium]|nr:response regulator [Lachnospiraceae bacterium]
MDKHVLLFAEKNTLLVNVMGDGLKKAGYIVDNIRITEAENFSIDKEAEMWLVYLPGEETEYRESYEMIKRELEMDNDKLLFLVGNPSEIKAETAFFEKEKVTESFARPFRVEDIVETIDKYVLNPGGTKHVLVVDDDPTALHTIKGMLSDNYNVYTANTAFNALRILDSTQIDLILLDYEMPIIKGPQLLMLLRNDPVTKDTPVMFLTSKNDKETISEALSVKPEKYLLKSLPKSEIIKALDLFFEGK